MSVSVRRPVSVQLWIIYALMICSGLGWMAAAFVLGQSPLPIRHIGFDILYQIAKATFIGSTAGVFLRYVVPGPTEEEKEKEVSLLACGIKAVYVSRREADGVFLKAVQDRHTRNLWMAGISLREFLLSSGPLHNVWLAIRDRLKDEHCRQIALSERLKVHILLLHPACPEGDFRFKVECDALAQGLKDDVPVAIQTILQLCHDMEPANISAGGGAAQTPSLEARLYEHGSFAFKFITDSFAIVEQYLYRDQPGDPAMPLVHYADSSAAYKQIVHSYGIVWNHAEPARIDETQIGVGRGLRESHLTGIFREENDRPLLTRREKHALQSGRVGDIIAIQALSGRFYVYSTPGNLQTATKPVGRCAKIRLLVSHPASRSAILRAVADSTAIENIGPTLRTWSWDKHKDSPLYIDVHSAIHQVERLRRMGCDIEMRLSAADLSCALLLTRDRMFVERYAYGRSKDFSTGVTLGGDAVFEYERPKPKPDDFDAEGARGGADFKDHPKHVGEAVSVPSEQRMLDSAFEVLWDSYSISAQEYCTDVNRDKESFEAEVKILLDQVSPDPPDDRICMIILAAGYGTRISADLERRSNLKGKPKGLLPVGGKPILEWLLEGVNGIEKIHDIVIVTNEKYFDQFQEWQRTSRTAAYRSIRIISDGTASNENRRGAIGALHFAVAREEVRGSVFVVGADNCFHGHFRPVIDEFLKIKTGVVVIHDEGSPDRVAGKFGVVTIGDKGQITDFEEKPERPTTSLASTLCYLLTKENIRRLKGYVRQNPCADSAGEFIRHLVQQGETLKAFEFDGSWHDIGTLAEYDALSQMMETSKR